MKKISFTLATTLALFIIIPVPAHAQTKPLFPFAASEKATVSPTPVQSTTAVPSDITEDTIDLNSLKNKPLPERRKIVAAELSDILLRLSVLYDKTKVATDRLTQNGIDTTLSQTELATAALSLADAKLTVDALVLAANDPVNEAAIILIVNSAPFKDGVIKAEDTLRSARSSIITTLTSLKAAVSSVTSPEAH